MGALRQAQELTVDFTPLVKAEVPSARPFECQRVSDFFNENRIVDVRDVTYTVRSRVLEFASRRGYAPAAAKQMAQFIDTMKINTLAEHRKEKIGEYNFLLYMSPRKNAMAYRQVKDKDVLLFDFRRLRGSIKQDFIELLQHIIDMDIPLQTKLRMYKVLHELQTFCEKRGIKRLAYMEQSQVRQFLTVLSSKSTKWLEVAPASIDLARRIAFVRDGKVDWECPVWYLDELEIDEERRNLADEVRTMSFLRICNQENRKLVQLYAKSLIGISSNSVLHIKRLVELVEVFVEYLEELGKPIVGVTRSEIEKFFESLESREMEARQYNNYVMAVSRFLRHVKQSHKEQICIDARMYKKKTYPVHINRTPSDDVIQKIIEHITELPEDMELIYWILLETGRRLNEVCTLKHGSVYEDAGQFYMRVYQKKFKRDIQIPICQELYTRMMEYAEVSGISEGEYLFTSQDGNPLNTTVYARRMNEFCKERGISCKNHVFQSHDYRHRIATVLHENGVSIGEIRKYLGHSSTVMTRRYVDDINEKLLQREKLYFTENPKGGKE